tara:strand:- start:616 stop:831 length:216 start_codon:yes stop_codon:yes gene_type:complete
MDENIECSACKMETTKLFLIQENLVIINKDVKNMKDDLSYIKNKIKILHDNKEKEYIKDVQTTQDGWFIWL